MTLASVELGDVCRIQNGYAFDSEFFAETVGLPLIRIRDIHRGTCSQRYRGQYNDAYLVEAGDLLVGMDGEFAIAKWAGERALLNQRVCRLIPNQDHLCPEYLLHRLKQELKDIEAKTPSTTVKHLSSKQIAKIRLELPPVEAQKKTASALNAQLADVQSALEAAKSQLHDVSALLDAVYGEAFHSLVPVAVPPVTVEAPESWRWQKLTDVARLESGHTPSRQRPDWWGGDVSWLSLTEIRALDGSWVDHTQLRTNAEGLANSAARLLPRGTVCLSRTASVGFVAIMGNPMATSQDFANWVCGDQLDPEFLMYALIRSRASLREMATGATHKTIYMPALASFHVCAPEIGEQKRIAERLKIHLGEIKAVSTALHERAKDISALPQRILATAFEK